MNNIQKAIDIITCCVNSSFTGRITIDFNSGGICQPILETSKIDSGLIKNLKTLGITDYMLTTTFKDGVPTKKACIKKELWLNEKVNM
jgi:hypothetical protein